MLKERIRHFCSSIGQDKTANPSFKNATVFVSSSKTMPT